MPAPAASLSSSRVMARCTAVLCALAVIAAVVSFVKGFWIAGTVWVLLTGLASNMAWYYGRRARRTSATGSSATGSSSGPSYPDTASGPSSSGAAS
ncbi:hypothetical protein HCC61_03525 [Streptomyces sp. HNM0575]|uniref:hypothetical protein n=1 Tax=Streptomyces sp. HNM0575 TaxID=2716338 RepID=UPI00145CECBE|nr:hypothetical protein [Streptomyces sp. HNM0575]NLU71763.1 hypothetical protein [Streptomyces sp. HNM0575]